MRVGRLWWGLIGLLFASASSEARAGEDPLVPELPATRRSGFTLGLSSGLAVARASGYPNDVTQIDLPEFESSTGVGASLGGAFWLGGSLADWLTVALGYQRGSFKANGLEATGGSIHARIEAYPLFFRGGAWQDAGLSLFVGTGNYDVKRAQLTVAEGEGTSAVGLGAFFEHWRFWRLATGPDVMYVHQFSRSLSAHSLIIGWRLAYYAGP